MSRNYGFGEFKATNKGSTNWRGIPQKINGGSTTSTTRRGVVILFPTVRTAHDWEIVELGRRQYRVRPGSWAERFWHLVTVAVEE